jgi:hypothetical protein
MTNIYVIQKPNPKLHIVMLLASFGLGLSSGANYIIWVVHGYPESLVKAFVAIVVAMCFSFIGGRIGSIYIIADGVRCYIIPRSSRIIKASGYDIGSEITLVMHKDHRPGASVNLTGQLTSHAAHSKSKVFKIGRFHRQEIPDELIASFITKS